MKFNRHSDVEGMHAFLSASSPYWLNDDDEELLTRAARSRAAARGTRMHNLAKECIELGVKMPNNSQTINLYVNDAIAYRMQPEVVLFHTYDSFGTADAISFRKEGDVMVLRIFDLKTGTKKTDIRQLKTYAAYFCLEYKVRPMEIEYDLRIYQNDEVHMYETDPEEIVYIMDRAIHANKLLNRAREEEVI